MWIIAQITKTTKMVGSLARTKIMREGTQDSNGYCLLKYLVRTVKTIYLDLNKGEHFFFLQ